AFCPIRKNVARTHWSASAASTRRVVGGKGPSSKVSTTSLSASGRVAGNSFTPTRGVSLALTLSVRNVPKALLPAQFAAPAAPVATTTAAAAATIEPTPRINALPAVFANLPKLASHHRRSRSINRPLTITGQPSFEWERHAAIALEGRWTDCRDPGR